MNEELCVNRVAEKLNQIVDLKVSRDNSSFDTFIPITRKNKFLKYSFYILHREPATRYLRIELFYI